MLRIALSSRSLFHMEDANALFEREGQAAYDAMMLEKEKEPLQPGMAFNLVSKLLSLNTPGLRDPDRVEVMLLSRNSASASVRIMNSVEHYGLPIHRAVFTSGHNRFGYAKAFEADLFLSATTQDTANALNNGMAAATMSTGLAPGRFNNDDINDDIVHIAFDGDSVVFSDEADKVFQAHGLDSFIDHERNNANTPLGAGPFKQFLTKLCELKSSLPDHGGECPLRVGLVTARSIAASGRVINTLRSWGLDIDEVVFAGGAPKGPLLRAFGADFFVDDTRRHVESAHVHDIPSALAPGMPGGIGAEPEQRAPVDAKAGATVLSINQVEQLANAQAALNLSNEAIAAAQAAPAVRQLARSTP